MYQNGYGWMSEGSQKKKARSIDRTRRPQRNARPRQGAPVQKKDQHTRTPENSLNAFAWMHGTSSQRKVDPVWLSLAAGRGCIPGKQRKHIRVVDPPRRSPVVPRRPIATGVERGSTPFVDPSFVSLPRSSFAAPHKKNNTIATNQINNTRLSSLFPGSRVGLIIRDGEARRTSRPPPPLPITLTYIALSPDGPILVEDRKLLIDTCYLDRGLGT